MPEFATLSTPNPCRCPKHSMTPGQNFQPQNLLDHANGLSVLMRSSHETQLRVSWGYCQIMAASISASVTKDQWSLYSQLQGDYNHLFI